MPSAHVTYPAYVCTNCQARLSLPVVFSLPRRWLYVDDHFEHMCELWEWRPAMLEVEPHA